MDPPSRDPSPKSQANLFQVYLRLRPPPARNTDPDRFLLVEEPEGDYAPTHITLNPPSDRRRAIEKFAFTRVFEEDATQLDLFHGTKVLPLVEGVLAPHGGDGTDGLLATLGVTGSGKTHTILGSRKQRGMTQLALDVLFRSISNNLVDCKTTPSLEGSIQQSDASEAIVLPAQTFLDTVYSDFSRSTQGGSRAATPLTVRPQTDFIRPPPSYACPQLPGHWPDSPSGSVRLVSQEDDLSKITMLSTPPSERPRSQIPSFAPSGARARQPKLARTPSPQKKSYMSLTSSAAQHKKTVTKTPTKGDYSASQTPRRNLQRPSALPQVPDISSIRASCDPSAEYAIVISMYEVYNDRIFDLLTPPIKSHATKEPRRRPLLFKPTELSPDRKMVAGLRKIICGSLNEALLVLEAGLHERRVAGTGSNSVSSRSHGFFCAEVKKRRRGRASSPWGGSTLSIVDLAGSERARDAKTQGATLAEAGKINESLMYLGQCLQMQSDAGNMSKPNLVPFRRCKLTELLFSNSFLSPSAAHASSTSSSAVRRNPQKGVMIVTADPLGDFNATSQILRYSALAREVTVPRIPSITSTILASAHVNAPAQPPSSSPELGSSPPITSPLSNMHSSRGYFSPSAPGGNHHHNYQSYQSHDRHPSGGHQHNRTFSPVSDTERATMENAALEIARMAEVIEQLNVELAREAEARMAAEAHLLSMEDRALELEQDVREECHADFERRLALEMGRFKASLEAELGRGQEHADRKVELMARVVVTSPTGGERLHRSVGSNSSSGDNNDDDDKENVLIENLEQENERLRREVAVLKRELAGRTPTKRAPLQERGDVLVSGSPRAGPSSSTAAAAADALEGLGNRLENLRVSDVTTASTSHDGGGGGRSGNVSGGSPTKKKLKKGVAVTSTGSPTKKVMRKLPAKRWEADDVYDDDDGGDGPF